MTSLSHWSINGCDDDNDNFSGKHSLIYACGTMIFRTRIQTHWAKRPFSKLIVHTVFLHSCKKWLTILKWCNSLSLTKKKYCQSILVAQVQIDFAYLISLEVLMIQWICAYLRWIKLIFFEWFYKSANAGVFYLQIFKKNSWQTSIFDLHFVHLSIDLWMRFIALNLHLFKMHGILDSLVHKWKSRFFFFFK